MQDTADKSLWNIKGHYPMQTNNFSILFKGHCAMLDNLKSKKELFCITFNFNNNISMFNLKELKLFHFSSFRWKYINIKRDKLDSWYDFRFEANNVASGANIAKQNFFI